MMWNRESARNNEILYVITVNDQEPVLRKGFATKTKIFSWSKMFHFICKCSENMGKYPQFLNFIYFAFL